MRHRPSSSVLDLASIGARVRLVRRLRGLTQEELHQRGAPARALLSRLEQSRRPYPYGLQPGSLLGLAHALQVHEEWLERGAGPAWFEEEGVPKEWREATERFATRPSGLARPSPQGAAGNLLGRYILDSADFALVARIRPTLDRLCAQHDGLDRVLLFFLLYRYVAITGQPVETIPESVFDTLRTVSGPVPPPGYSQTATTA